MDGKDRREDNLAAAAAAASPAISVPAGEIEEIFRTHHRRVFQAAYRVTGNAADAEDVLGTVFLRLLGGRTDLIEHLESYLHRAAVNAALDLLRTRREGSAVPLEQVAPFLAQDARLQPDREHYAGELRALLREALARLNPKAAEIVALRYFEGYGYGEIGRMLGISQINVAVTLHRSRRQLRQRIQHRFRAPTGGATRFQGETP